MLVFGSEQFLLVTMMLGLHPGRTRKDIEHLPFQVNFGRLPSSSFSRGFRYTEPTNLAGAQRLPVKSRFHCSLQIN